MGISTDGWSTLDRLCLCRCSDSNLFAYLIKDGFGVQNLLPFINYQKKSTQQWPLVYLFNTPIQSENIRIFLEIFEKNVDWTLTVKFHFMNELL